VQERKIVESYQDSLFAWRHFGVCLIIMTFSFPFKYIKQPQTYGLKPHLREKKRFYVPITAHRHQNLSAS